MNDTKKTEDKKDTKGVNPVVAAVTGAIVGAGIVAGAIAINDKPTRDKVTGAIDDVKAKAENMIKESQVKVADEKENMKALANMAIDKMNNDAKAVVNG
jgi:hypothetical protein